MRGFALYRMPYAQTCQMLSGKVLELTDITQLSGRQGYVVAPFIPSAERPLLLIEAGNATEATAIDRLPIADTLTLGSLPLAAKNLRADYHACFTRFHDSLCDGAFQKLVLSRCADIMLTRTLSPIQLFRLACESYPRVFVSLTYTPQSGLWLTATPEVLLAGENGQWRTVALAGTMPYDEHVRWDDKNVQEQRYVATYIASLLAKHTEGYTEDGPHTVRAGHLAHLRSDFRFTLSDHASIGHLLQALHPTPAVCGLPKESARDFILRNESHDRSYYSGFMGPLSVDGATSLYVTLRCMRIFQNGCRLYAGGGLLKDSDEEQEWMETETKLDTMRRILCVTPSYI